MNGYVKIVKNYLNVLIKKRDKKMKKIKKLKLKIKKISKKNPFVLPITIIVILIIAIIGISLMPSIIQYITHEGDVVDDDSTNIYDPWNFFLYDYSIWEEITGEFEEIIYVHQDGSNETGGRNWDEAYTDLPSAIARAEGTEYWTTLILCGAGIWDVCTPTAQLIDRNIILVGAGRDLTTFINTHPLADSVFRTTWAFKGYRFTIRMSDACDGIVVGQDWGYFDVKSDIRLENVMFTVNVSNNANTEGLRLENSELGKFNNLHFEGWCHAAVIAINISNSHDNDFSDIRIHHCKMGIIFTLNTSDYNHFDMIDIYNSSVGINIDAGNVQHFESLIFSLVGNPVDDEVGDSVWFDIQSDNLIGGIQPQDLVGVDVDTDIVANTYGVDVLVCDAIDSDRPYYLVAILFEADAGERYGLRLWEGIGYFYETVLESKFVNQMERWSIELPNIFNAHSRIYCSIKSETGGDDMDIWTELVAI